MKTTFLSQLLIISCILFGCNSSDDYKSTQIGNQIWMTNNLNVDNFQNGDIIFEAKTKDEWNQAIRKKQPAWCYFDNKKMNGEKYGKLYNWFAISNVRNLAPKGWRIPNVKDWDILFNQLGGKSVAGKKLKSKFGWADNGSGTDEFEFNAIPTGWRDSQNEFSNENGLTMFWINSQNNYQFVVFDYALDELDINPCDTINYGFSVRCIKE